MVNRSCTIPNLAGAIDEAMKEFFTNLLQTSRADLQNSINEVSRNMEDNALNINNMLVTQQYLTIEVHKLKEGERPNQRGPVLQLGRMSRIDLPRFKV